MGRNELPKVVFVSHSSWLAGAERALVRLLTHIPVGRIQPIVVFPKTKGAVKEFIEKKIGLPTFELDYVFSIPKVGELKFVSRVDAESSLFERFFREIEADCVVVNTTVVLPAALAAARQGIPLLVHSHGAIFRDLFRDLDCSRWGGGERIQLQLADKVIVPSAWVATHYRRAYGLIDDQIVVLPNGTELSWDDEVEDDESSPAVSTFVMLCTLEVNKGVAVFFEAAKKVLADRPGVANFLVYGDGSLEFLSSLNDFIDRNNLRPFCSISPKQEDVSSVYRDCTAVVVASTIESFSMVAIEAMSFGKPVIATKCGGPEGIVIEGETGYLIDIDDVPALAARMVKLIDDCRLCSRLGAAGRERVKEVFEIRKISSMYVDLICEQVFKETVAVDQARKRLMLSTCMGHSEGRDIKRDFDVESGLDANWSEHRCSNRGQSPSEEVLLEALAKTKSILASVDDGV